MGLKYLKLLDVSDCDAITGHGFAHLPDSPVLEDLNVSLCHKIQDSALRHIYRAKSLNALSLAECWNLTNAAMRVRGGEAARGELLAEWRVTRNIHTGHSAVVACLLGAVAILTL